MAIRLTSTKDVHANGVKVLVYGESGVGKTTLIRTLPQDDTVIISIEGGLLSLAGTDIPVIEVGSLEDLKEAYRVITEGDGAKFGTVAIDSVSELGEVILHHEKEVAKDPRQAYGAMADAVADQIRKFRDLPGKDIYMTAKLDKIQTDTGAMLYSASLPGKKAGMAIPYAFDLVLPLRAETDQEGNRVRALQTQPDGVWLAKDRSGKLDFWEEPDLGKVFQKIKGGVE